uniref:Uncharacterized protein n=1 Tax=Musca domestica TaxID=7370 RepID=A0A1I8NKT3_MUSDO
MVNAIITTIKTSLLVYLNFYLRDLLIILMAIAYSSYKFVYINVFSKGRVNNKLHLPPPEQLTSRTISVPCILVGVDAFALISNVVKPFSVHNINAIQRNVNYRPRLYKL